MLYVWLKAEILCMWVEDDVLHLGLESEICVCGSCG